MKRWLFLVVLASLILSYQIPAQVTLPAYKGILAGGASGPSFVSQANFVVDSAVTGISGDGNHATLSMNITGSNTLLVACWEVEFDGSLSEFDAVGWEFRFNGIWGRQFYGTQGYAGGASNNHRLRCAYWTNPTAGTHDLVIVLTAGVPGVSATIANEIGVCAVLFNNAAQTYWPFRDTQKDISATTRTSETETVTSSTTDLVVHVMASSHAVIGTIGAGETTVSQTANAGADITNVLVTTKAGTSSVTVGSTGWPTTPTPFPLEGLAFSIKAAGAAEDHIIFTDDFQRANETPLSKAGAWTQPVWPTLGAVNLTSNIALGTAALESIAIPAAPAFGVNQRSKIVWQGGQFTRVWLRVSATGGYMLTSDSASSAEIYAVANNGSSLGYTQLGATITFNRNLVTGDILELEVNGTTLNAYFNGQLFATRTDSTYTAGQPGLGSFGATAISSSYQATSLPARN